MPRRKSTAEPESLPVPALRLEWRSPSELAENPRNWRRHDAAQIDALSDALAEVGWAGACLYNERTGRLIDGHARRKVALEQGADKIPVLVGSWDEVQEAKILATLDPVGAMATADAAALDALLRDVQTASQPLADMLAGLAVRSGVVSPESTVVTDPAAEWRGMPEFEHEDKTAYRSLVVHFADEQAVQGFAQIVGQNFSAEAKYIYYPEKERAEHAGENYADDS
jgi:hypothetical protein